MATLVIGVIAGVGTTYLQNAVIFEDTLDWRLELAPEPIAKLVSVARFARETASPAPLGRIDYHFGETPSWRPSWARDGEVSGDFRDVHIDLVDGRAYSAAFDGPWGKQLTAAQVATLHRLAALSCRQRWDHDPGCHTHEMYDLEIDDGSCTLRVRGTCPEHKELLAAVLSFAGWTTFPW